MEAPILRYDFNADNPAGPVQERLAVYAGGQAALWVTAAVEPAARTRSGSWLLQLGSEALAPVSELAQRLVEMRADPDHYPGRGVLVEENVLARHGERKQGHNLNYRYDEELPEVLAAALELRGRLRGELKAAPAAVVELAVRRMDRMGKQELLYILSNPGSRTVEMAFDADQLAVWGQGPAGRRQLWQHPGELNMGLVGRMGEFIDGLYAPAEIAPGETGRLLLPLDSPVGPALEGEELWAGLKGRIRLVGPGFEDNVYPDTPFVVACRLE